MTNKKFNLSNKVDLVNNIQKYLKSFKFNKTINLLDQNALILNWSNSSHLINTIRKKFKINEDEYTTQKEFATSTINSLKTVPVWLNTQGHIIPMTMYDVYHTMSQFIKKESYETELYNVHDISFLGPLGPYKAMPLIDCINEQTLKIFLNWQLICNKMPQRSFRINTKGMIHSQIIQGSKVVDTTFEVSQITNTGLLLKSNNELLLEKLPHTDNVKFYFDSEKIEHVLNKNSNERDLYYTENKLSYFSINSNKIKCNLKYDSHKTGEVFLFCRYHHMKESDIPLKLQSLTNELQAVVEESVA